MAAITAKASLPGKGELYVGDYWGHPKALHERMEAVHEIRHDRYLTDVVSAFCGIMGLQISTTMLRRPILGTQGMNDDARGTRIVRTFQ